jgi:serine/threonine protein phosphatase PrpC
MKDIKVFGLTDVGMVRPHNEDHYLLKVYDDMVVAAVADGMGGAAYGEVASRITVETVEDLFEKNRGSMAAETLVGESLLRSHQKIREEGKLLHGNMSMGTTCTLVAVARRKTKSQKRPPLLAYMGHIGDSRIYLIYKDEIQQKSTDHTMVQKLLEAGALKPEDANRFVHKGIIYKSLGGSEQLKIDSVEIFSLKRGNVLLLCSDGFSNYIGPAEMVKSLQAKPDLEQAAHYMVELAKYRGGDDNITVVLIEYGRYPRKRNIELEEVPGSV